MRRRAPCGVRLRLGSSRGRSQKKGLRLTSAPTCAHASTILPLATLTDYLAGWPLGALSETKSKLRTPDCTSPSHGIKQSLGESASNGYGPFLYN